MLEQMRRLTPYTTVPLIAKPNAGLPETVEGQAVYHLSLIHIWGREYPRPLFVYPSSLIFLVAVWYMGFHSTFCTSAAMEMGM